jgi:diacylglycerol kinase (ATP)
MKELNRLRAALGHACAGLKDASKHPAFRTELWLSALLIPLAFIITDNATHRILLISSLMLVMIVELLNTGIEITVDRISTDWHPLSKRAKDIGSAAVLLSVLNAIIVWLCVLWSVT